MKVGVFDSFKGEFEKFREGSVEDVRRVRGEVVDGIGEQESKIRDVARKFERDIKDLRVSFEKNSVEGVKRDIEVLGKEIDRVVREQEVGAGELGDLKKGVEDRLFDLERGFDVLRERVEELASREGVEDSHLRDVAKEIGGRVKDVGKRVGVLEGRVDVELGKIDGRLRESLDLMMFWEKKFNEFSGKSFVKRSVSGVGNFRSGKKKVSGVEGRKKVLEKLRRGHLRRKKR